MNEQENTKIVQQAYEHFKSGNIGAFLDLYADDVDFELPEVENVPFAGKHKGRVAVARFCQLNGNAQEALAYNVQELIAKGDKVVALGSQQFRVKANGREYGGDWVHIITLRDGKIVSFKEFTDTAASAAAYQSASRV